MRHAVERQQVVHAQRLERDVADQHELVVALVGKDGRAELGRRQELGERGGDPARRVEQIGCVGVGADRAQQVPRGSLCGGEVELRGVDDASGRRRSNALADRRLRAFIEPA